MIQYPAIINPTQTIIRDITSAEIGQSYRLFISLPQSYDQNDQSFPVLYLLDANATLALVKPIIEFQQIMDLVPELIIVGIGYPQPTYMDTLAMRGRDFTHGELSPEVTVNDLYPWEKTGGASAFFKFLAETLIPTVEHEFRVQATDRTLAGYSLGGQFALYAMLQQPTLFLRVIAASPSATDDMLDNEHQHDAALPLKLVLLIEAATASDENLRETERVRSFVKTLTECYQDLETVFQVFDGLDHALFAPVAFAHGVRAAYK